MSLLKKFYDDDIRDEIVAALRQIPNVQEECRNYLDRNLISIAKTPHVVEKLLALGVDTDDDYVHVPAENSLFLRMLQHFNLYNHNVRETAKLLMSANPDLDQQHGVVELAIVQDELMYKTEHLNSSDRDARMTDITGSYQSDANEHGICGYDNCAFALNFVAPFFLECGFPVSRRALEESVFKNLHPAEINYIQTYLDNPKPLKVACRDAMRQNFKCLKIRKFLEASNCPKTIQDFILMKHLLQPTVFQGSVPYLHPCRF